MDYPHLTTAITLAALATSLGLSACQSPQPSRPEGTAPADAHAGQHTLVIVANQVPTDFAAKGLAGGTGAATGVAENVAGTIFNATLAIADDRGRVSPYLASALPKLNTDSWKLFPDGSMETTYTLKPNLTWHDGQPLTAEDFVFAWEVYATPAYGVDRSIPIRFMSQVLAPDPSTVVIRWSERYADAGRLTDELPPLPRHILEAQHRQSVEGSEASLPNSPFWNTNYVGAGPYKVDSYDPAVSIEASAFDAHILGRPKINRVSIRGIPDVNAALAATIAGDVDFAADLFRAEEGLILERDWVSRGAGVVLWEALGSRTLNFQFNPEFASPPEIATDVRVRQAIAHAIDKKESYDVVTGGHGLLADARTHPGEEYYPQVDREITKYPYDPRRAEQLMIEAGYTRGSGGGWLTPRGTGAELPVWFTGGASLFEQENSIIVAQLKQFGFDAVSKRFPSSGTREDRAKLPGMLAVGSNLITQYHTDEIPNAANRWSGGNRGNYSNPELDGLIDRSLEEVNPDQLLRLTIQMEKIVSADLPGIFLYWHSRAWAHVASLKGPKIRTSLKGGSPLRNIHEWEWTQ
ncbi:MAG TPA: peptide ABC transporter substrate-binding protein [Chloroflexota bacterium]|nr:peptide ABC transporter substrate-binding protein [Chloroflexota bacterium]